MYIETLGERADEKIKYYTKMGNIFFTISCCLSLCNILLFGERAIFFGEKVVVIIWIIVHTEVSGLEYPSGIERKIVTRLLLIHKALKHSHKNMER